MARPRKKPLTEAQVEALDHDGDGKAGGSLPRALGAHELAAIGAEAYEAYDRFHYEVMRHDSLGRKWVFSLDKVNGGESVLSISVSLLDDVRRDTISTALLASDLGRDMCADVVARLSGVVDPDEAWRTSL
jgi:hypothetical protein